jgi:hypothetical protein
VATSRRIVSTRDTLHALAVRSTMLSSPRDRLLANTVRGNFRFSPVSGAQDRLEGAATVRGGSDATR